MNDDVKRLIDDEDGRRHWSITGDTAKRIVDQRTLVEALRDGPQVRFQTERHLYRRALNDLVGGEFFALKVDFGGFPSTGEIAVTEVFIKAKSGGMALKIKGKSARKIAQMHRAHYRLDREIEMLEAKRSDLEQAIEDATRGAIPGGIDFAFSPDPSRFDEDGSIVVREIDEKPT